MISHIAFDFDGTLADSGRCALMATEQVFHKFQLPVPTEEQITASMGIPIEQSFKEWAPSTDTAALCAAFRTAYRDLEADHIQCFPQIIPMLRQLKRYGIGCSVVTSKHTQAAQRNLDLLHLSPYITTCIGSDQVAHYKPHPESLLLLQQQLTIPANQLVMVGDATFDINMGHAAGVATCAVTWGSHTPQQLAQCHPTWMIDSPEQLITTLLQKEWLYD